MLSRRSGTAAILLSAALAAFLPVCSGCTEPEETVQVPALGREAAENEGEPESYQDPDGYVYRKTRETVTALIDVNIRRAASGSSEIAGVLKEGDSIVRIAENESWSKVEYDGGICYIATAYLAGQAAE